MIILLKEFEPSSTLKPTTFADIIANIGCEISSSQSIFVTPPPTLEQALMAEDLGVSTP